MANQIPGPPNSYYVVDTANTNNALVQRDANGNVAVSAANVTQLVLSGLLVFPRVSKTAAFTADATSSYYACDATTAAFAATLPPAASCSGRVYTFKKIDASANAVTVTGNSTETIDGSNTKALSSQWQHTTIQSNGTSWEVIV